MHPTQVVPDLSYLLFGFNVVEQTVPSQFMQSALTCENRFLLEGIISIERKRVNAVIIFFICNDFHNKRQTICIPNVTKKS